MHICNQSKECPISGECEHGDYHEFNDECNVICEASFSQLAECVDEN